MNTIDTIKTNEQIEVLDATAQQQVLGGNAALTGSIAERECEIRTAEIFRIEIERTTLDI